MRLLDEAEVRAEFRRHYREVGFNGCVQILAELLMSTQILCEVMKEEQENERH